MLDGESPQGFGELNRKQRRSSWQFLPHWCFVDRLRAALLMVRGGLKG
jgi:hypothetical protein